MKHAPLTFLAVALLIPVAMAQQTIRVPDQIATLEAAIAMAADGDRILLTAASYPIPAAGLTLGKSLIIETVGEERAQIIYPASISAPASLTAQPALRITSLGSHGRIVLRNLTFTGGFSFWAYSPVRPAVIDVQLPTHYGALVMQDVHAIGETRHADEACPALRLQVGPGVDMIVRSCRFEGASGQSPLFAGGELEYDGSPGVVGQCLGVLLAECTQFVGGAGGRADWPPFGPFPLGRRGGDAVRLVAPWSALKNCDLVEGIGGPVTAAPSPFAPDRCAAHGWPGQFVTTAELLDCVRTVVPQGCGQTVQYWPLQVGSNDVECIPMATVGVPFRFKVRAESAGLGFTMLLVGSRVGALEVPGIAGLLRLEDPAGVGILAPSTPTSWTDVWVGSVPSTLGWLPTIAVQPLHLDSNGLRFGSFATFTVR